MVQEQLIHYLEKDAKLQEIKPVLQKCTSKTFFQLKMKTLNT